MAIEEMQKSYLAGESSWEPHGNKGCTQWLIGHRAAKLATIITCVMLVIGINLRRNRRTR